MKKQPRNLEELLQNDSFVRWMRDLSDAQEAAYWEQWINRSPSNKKLAEEARDVLKAMQFNRVDTSDVEEELQKLNAQIDSEIPVGATPIHQSSNLFRYVAAAAVALIIFSTGFFMLDQYSFSSDQLAEVPVQTKIQEQVYTASASKVHQNDSRKKIGKISTDFAEKTTLVFDDGSRVVLNAKSTLEYPSGNTEQGNITVRLKGEAYFDIAERAPQNKRTFTVQTENGTVNVLGTKFSVQADDERTEVALKEGVVEIKKKGNASNTFAQYTMKPGELAQFGKLSSSIKVNEIDPAVYFSWTQNMLQFHNTSLSKIAQRIEQTYGVQVVTNNPSVMDKKISGSIENNDLTILLDALSELLRTPIKRNKNTITIGT